MGCIIDLSTQFLRNKHIGRLLTEIGSMLARIALLVSVLLAAPVAFGADEKRSAHDYEFTAIDGGPLALSDYAGQVVLVVNTASRCGFTRQYGDLQEVWERYREQGLVVLGVPSNDFGGQEPGSEAQIKAFCEVNFNIDFPMTAKTQVRGDTAHPFYQWAAEELGAAAAPRWNFHKYLIGRDGTLVNWFSTPTAPTSKPITSAIEAQLAKPSATGT